MTTSQTDNKKDTHDNSVVTPEVVDEIAPFLAQALPGLLPEAELSALPEAPLMPFDATGRFEQAVPFGLEEYLGACRA